MQITDQIDTAENGLIAVQKVEKSSPGFYDVIFMDISMPVMDGLAATRAIRAYEKRARCKAASIVALTGLTSVNAEQEAFSCGMDLFVTKPVAMKALKGMLEGVLKEREQIWL
jgi:CheY-like chemotaxis protein